MISSILHIILWSYCLIGRGDETTFRHTLTQLETAVRKQDTATIRGLLHFPFLTGPQDMATDGWIDATEFSRYYASIFHADVYRLLPHTKEAEIAQIARDTKEKYYKRLMKLSDPGAPLYEVYIQYPEARNQGDSYFGFVFGRISGQYKVVSYYAKWPVKN